MRLPPEALTEKTIAGGAINGWVAYSKICTHAGCSVGLLGVDNRPPDTLRQLVCPCHQSVFDPVDAARPVGGPAPRPLPQLPLEIDAEGFLIAKSDFPGVVGPARLERGRRFLIRSHRRLLSDLVEPAAPRPIAGDRRQSRIDRRRGPRASALAPPPLADHPAWRSDR